MATRRRTSCLVRRAGAVELLVELAAATPGDRSTPGRRRGRRARLDSDDDDRGPRCWLESGDGRAAAVDGARDFAL